MRYVRTFWPLAVAAGLACSQNFEKGDVNPPQQAARPASPHAAAAPQSPAKGMTPMSERTYGGAAASAPAAQSGEKSVSGTITLSPELAGRIPAGATLFVMAKERLQGGAPYAVQRLPVPDFPFRYSVDQADVLPMFGEGLQFGDIDEMYIVARIDRDGRVGQPDPGDLEGGTKTVVKPGQKGVDIVIDRAY